MDSSLMTNLLILWSIYRFYSLSVCQTPLSNFFIRHLRFLLNVWLILKCSFSCTVSILYLHTCVLHFTPLPLPLISNSALTSFAELLIHTLKEAGAQLGITVEEVGV